MPRKDCSSAPDEPPRPRYSPPSQPGCPVPDCACSARCLPGYLTPENYRRVERDLIRLGHTTGRPRTELDVVPEPPPSVSARQDAPAPAPRASTAPQPWEPRPPRRRRT